MTTQLLIYETAVPVSNGRHAQNHVDSAGGYAFCRNVNAVPLLAVEFPSASNEYTIVFAGEGDALMPAVVLGMRGKENAYLDPDDGWRARYVPAFIRRYPFVFSKSEDGKTFTLCIDEAFAGFNREGRGQALFGADGKPSAYVQNVLKFLQDYQAQFQRTQVFCQKLKQLDLLEPMQARVSLESGENLSLTGFMAINRDRLKALSPHTLAELAQTDELELMYLHLQSMRNFNQARDRLVVMAGGKSAPEHKAQTGDAAMDPEVREATGT